jgi:hypothetical protein
MQLSANERFVPEPDMKPLLLRRATLKAKVGPLPFILRGKGEGRPLPSLRRRRAGGEEENLYFVFVFAVLPTTLFSLAPIPPGWMNPLPKLC